MFRAGVKALSLKLSTCLKQVRSAKEAVLAPRGEKGNIDDQRIEAAEVMPVTPEYRAVKSLVEAGEARWSGGKPKGVTGIRLRGLPLAETVLEERR